MGIPLSPASGHLTCRPVTASAKTNARPNEVQVVFLISLLAAIHVFVFAAAFPFFNPVDEQLHFDLAVRYSQGQVPRGLEPLSAESVRYIVLFSSRAYLTDPASLPDGKLPPPLWRQPLEQVMPELSERAAAWKVVTNTESTMPPLYYATAGAWWQAGKAAGIGNELLLYWLRFLNIPVVMAVVWLAWFTARKVFPTSLFARLAMPLIIAFVPQTAFYSINNDILAPLSFGAVFLAMLKLREAETPTLRLTAGLGLALAATYLTKISTLPALAVCGLFIGWQVVLAARRGNLGRAFPALAVLAGCALLPAAAWIFWCKTHYGDFTGSALKIEKLGWTHKPFAEWWHHPLFTLQGLWTFAGDTMATFWQGEFLWMRQPLALPALDAGYKVLTLALLGLSIVALLKRQAERQPAGLWLALACLAATAAFFALLSLQFDFQDCFYPSRVHPFFTSGRLYLGILIPILILFAGGLEFALQTVSQRTKFIALGLWLTLMLAGEVALDWRVFGCAYNWYHL